MQTLLHGYRFSVYTRIARVALHEKGAGYETVEIDPFADDVPASYRDLHPFGRVPVLTHGDFTVYETGPIIRYVDAAFEGPGLTPGDARAAARMSQAMAVIDNYGYWPMVRQVFSHRVFRAHLEEPVSEKEVAAGMEASHGVLSALEHIAAEGLILTGETVTLADCHLAPMFDYFCRAPEGAEAMEGYPALTRWWGRIRDWPGLVETDPGLPEF